MDLIWKQSTTLGLERPFAWSGINGTVTDDGILIRPVKPASQTSSLQLKMEKARASKVTLYKQMEEQANRADTIAYYENGNNTFDDVDVDIL
jgi:hypothetical protein